MKLLPSVDPALNTVQHGQEVTSRHVVDGATSLLDAAIQLQLLSSYWMRLHAVGWTLLAPMEHGAGQLVAPEGRES